MNFCIFKGKVIDEVKFDFIYNSKKISVAKTKLGLENGSCLKIKGFDEMADWMYRNIGQGDIAICSGKIDSNLDVEIEWIRIIT